MSGHYVVIGLGRLGSAMLGNLLSLGHEVLDLDSDQEVVQELSARFPDVRLFAVDASDE
jgi:Trk K+ transport system NAD-binding subunit